MTLIAGIRCSDGFLVAADTAVTTGNAVYHGSKLHWYRGPGYKLVVGCAGDLTYARMTSQTIRDLAAARQLGSLSEVREIVTEALVDVYSRHVFPHWKAQGPRDPSFSLIVGAQTGSEWSVLVSEETAIEEVSTYAFQGSGTELAQYLSETLLRSRGNDILPFPTAAAVHLAIEIFGIAKLYGASVGLDTQIVAWRSDKSYSPFSMPMRQQVPQSDIAIIQENFKHALWATLDRSSTLGEVLIQNTARLTGELLTKLHGHTREQGNGDVRYIRYWLSPNTGEWSMADLDPNRNIPTASAEIG